VRRTGSMAVPPEGTSEDLAERLRGYVERYRPGWSRRVRGVTDGELAELEALAGLTDRGWRYPDSFRRHLALCGHDDDGLLGRLCGTYGTYRTFGHLRDCYREQEGGEFDPRYPLVLGNSVGCWLAVDVQPPRPDEPPVLYEDTDQVYAGSWERLLFQHVAAECGIATLAVSGWASASRRTADAALTGAGFTGSRVAFTAVTADLGLEPGWFNDDQHFCAFGPDLAVWSVHDIGVMFYVSGPSEAAVRRIAAPLIDATGAGPLTPLSR
jgi:hypothetical protein